MDLPFSKIIVDSRHAANGDANNFDITLPESLTLPPNAVCYTTDIAIAHLFASMGSGPSLRNMFYWVERIGDTSSSLDYLNRAILDPTQTSNAVLLAAEIQAKMNAASVFGWRLYCNLCRRQRHHDNYACANRWHCEQLLADRRRPFAKRRFSATV